MSIGRRVPARALAARMRSGVRPWSRRVTRSSIGQTVVSERLQFLHVLRRHAVVAEPNQRLERQLVVAERRHAAHELDVDAVVARPNELVDRQLRSPSWRISRTYSGDTP